MKDLLLMYAKYTQSANASVIELLDCLTEDDRNKDRKSFFKSLSGLACHALGSFGYFHGLFRGTVSAPALKASEGLEAPESDRLSQAEWSELKKAAAIADQATVDFIRGLDEKDFTRQVKVEWFGGDPESVPLHYLLSVFIMHGVHHRGQISQILDEMGIEHDYSGIDVRFLHG